MRRKISLLALLLGAAMPLLSACSTMRAVGQTRNRARDDDSRSDSHSETPFTWSGTVAQGRWVYVRNLNGRVRVEEGSGSKVEVTAEKRWRSGDPRDVQISVRQIGGGSGDVIVCALWNERSSCDEDGYHSRGDNWNWFNNSRRDVQVEFTIHLPRGVKINASTVNGGVEIDGASSSVVAHTVNGSIEARSTGGSVSAHTTNGNLTISSPMLDGDRNEYTTTNGSISLELPASVNAEIDMRTVNGRLSSDFPLTVEGSFSPRRLHAMLGRGGPTLRLSTVNGSIRLRKLS